MIHISVNSRHCIDNIISETRSNFKPDPNPKIKKILKHVKCKLNFAIKILITYLKNSLMQVN